MTDLDPNHPALIQGRRHSRDVLEAAARIVRTAGATSTAATAPTLSTALQLIVSTALVDGFIPQEAYQASAQFLAWLVCRLPETDRLGVLTAMTSEVVSRAQLAEATVN